MMAAASKLFHCGFKREYVGLVPSLAIWKATTFADIGGEALPSYCQA
jgi:hypothetical protein